MRQRVVWIMRTIGACLTVAIGITLFALAAAIDGTYGIVDPDEAYEAESNPMGYYIPRGERDA